jgi:hypothetical protein
MYMIRTVIKPSKQNVSIKLPEEFVGKQVEVIAFTVDEAISETNITDKTLTHLASEKILAKDWLNTDEDKAWQDL